MLKNQFKDQLDFNIYLSEQKIRMEKGYLTVSERNQFNQMLDKNYKPTFIKEEKPKLPIVTNYNFLRKPCQEITKEDNIKEIIQKLKDTLNNVGGLGISANQIGILKKISYIRIPQMKDKKLDFKELILINPKIIEKNRYIKVKNEACLSFPGIYIDTKRYIFITVINYNEKLEPNTFLSQDLEAITIQHESDHLDGITIMERKWRAK